MVANMVHGVGFTPMFTLGTVYIDENEEHTMAAVYVGECRVVAICSCIFLCTVSSLLRA